MSAKRQWNKQFFYVLNFCQTVLCKISLTVWASDEWKARYANQILWACTRALDKDSRATAFHLAQEHHECHDRLSHRTAGGKRCSWEPIFLKAADFTIAVMYSKCCLDCFFFYTVADTTALCQFIRIFFPFYAPANSRRRRHYVFWSVRPSVHTYFEWRDISVLSGGISMNIHHVSGPCWTGFQGQRSKVKVKSRPVNL